MNIIFPVTQKQVILIHDGIKPFLFLKRFPRQLQPEDIIYLYEKKNPGSGLVVAKTKRKQIWKLGHHKLGAYEMLSQWAERFGTEEEKKQVGKAMSIDLEDYDNSLVLHYLYDEDALDEMIKTKTAPEHWNFYRRSVKEYDTMRQKSMTLLSKCDHWLSDIGFYEDDEESCWNYVLEIEQPEELFISKSLSEFLNQKEQPIQRITDYSYTIT